MGQNRSTAARRLAASLGGVIVVMLAVLVATDVGRKVPPCTTFSEKLRGKTSFPAPPCRFIDDAIFDAKLETTLGVMTLSLDTRLDGPTVNNFVFLARTGFYDGITFHRVESDDEHGFVQTGDRSGTGRGTAGYTYEADAPSPITQYIRGMVAMAHPPGELDATSSQFFILSRPWPAISGPDVTPEYPFFGYLADRASEAVLDAIIAAPRSGTRPEPPVILKRVTITERAFTGGR